MAVAECLLLHLRRNTKCKAPLQIVLHNQLLPWCYKATLRSVHGCASVLQSNTADSRLYSQHMPTPQSRETGSVKREPTKRAAHGEAWLAVKHSALSKSNADGTRLGCARGKQHTAKRQPTIQGSRSRAPCGDTSRRCMSVNSCAQRRPSRTQPPVPGLAVGLCSAQQVGASHRHCAMAQHSPPSSGDCHPGTPQQCLIMPQRSPKHSSSTSACAQGGSMTQAATHPDDSPSAAQVAADCPCPAQRPRHLVFGR